MSSAWEILRLAATVVLASAGPIKHRLAEAYREYLADPEEDELPRVTHFVCLNLTNRTPQTTSRTRSLCLLL